MPGLDSLIDTSYGPFALAATAERVESFVAAIGDDPSRWSDEAHPMFANAAVFAAAPAFLEDPRVVPFTRSLIHSEQRFEWHRPLPVDATTQVTGSVVSVRARGPLHLVGFSMEAGFDGSPWVTGTSQFVMSEAAAARAEEVAEPTEEACPETAGPLDPLPPPPVGEPVAPVAFGASRADLRRYGAASGDRSPIHHDHDAAVAAGLGGIVVHGLLMAAWLGRLAGRYGSLHSMQVRFRSPLRPATPASAGGMVAGADGDRVELDLELTSDDNRLLTSRVAVTA